MSETRTAWGWGLASVDHAGTTLDVWYPEAHLGRAPADGERPAHGFGALAHDEPDMRGVRRVPVFTESALDTPIRDAADAYLRLHLLSLRLARPNSINLDGIFARLANVVWTTIGPFAVEDFPARRLEVMHSRAADGGAIGGSAVRVLGVDKFPRMVDYVVPSGVRIADADEIRLGAYLAPGTTVMPSGSVNYNAGTLGESMVEGRIAQGVVVGDHSDIGVNATTIGTLSGGGHHRVSIGEHTLLGAQSGIGISLGDDCVVEAGLYIMPGTKVTVTGDASGQIDGAEAARATDDAGQADDVHVATPRRIVKAIALSGHSHLLFLRNSVTGAVEARPRTRGIDLNEQLHRN